MRRAKVVIALNTAWNLLNFRADLIRAFLNQGYEVVAVAPHDEYAERVSSLGCQFVVLTMDNHGVNPFHDALLWWRYRQLLKRVKPDVFLGFTVKPNVFGSLAAHSLGIPVVNNISGLGSVFNKNTWLKVLVRGLYRLALSKSSKVYFQNQDDLDTFVQERIVRPEIANRLPGSGVDLSKFMPSPNRLPREQMTFLLVARMLKDKGVVEYVQAAALLKTRYPETEFAMLGFIDEINPNGISRDQIMYWEKLGVVTYWGVTDDVRIALERADVIVLPSYREGTPRSLLEAAASAKPIITTDVPGCRDVVDDGVNGFLCQARDEKDLARAMAQMLCLSAKDRARLGQNGRLKVERYYDKNIVEDEYLKTLSTLT